MFIHRLKKLYTNNMKKLGHQAPQGYRVNLFNSIELDGDFALCDSHILSIVQTSKKQNCTMRFQIIIRTIDSLMD